MDDVYLRKVCSGDSEAFRYFIKQYKDMAFSIAMSVVKDEFIAQEVVQDAFVKAFNGLKSFNQHAKFSTWFYRIVVNESLIRFKKLKKEIISFKADYESDIPDETAIESLKDEERIHMINEALKKLIPNESLALRLFYLQEESIKEVCQITGWSESNTKVTLHRARKNMLTVLSRMMKSEIKS